MEANPHKIGNARQQNDNLMAVQDAIGLGLCWQALSAYLETQELSSSDYVPNQMASYQAYVADNPGPQADAWIKSAIVAEKAANVLCRAIVVGVLPIWRIHDAREVQVAPVGLETGNIRHGTFKTYAHPEPDMQGAQLWVKCADWASFLSALRTARQATQGGGDVPPNRTLNHAEIIERARSMRADQPGISKGSAAASIVADLPANPRSGKPRDTRHIERIIAHLWEGGL